MSHANKKCLRVQAMERFQEITTLGRSKHDDKVKAAEEYERNHVDDMSKREYINEAIRDKIYSINTYATYEKHNNYFLDYCEREHGCKTLAQCREYVDEWLQSRIDSELSARTIKTEAAALGKLYGEPTTNFGVELPECKREDITRSRGRAARDFGFSLENNAEIINFARATGLRRDELEHLRPGALIEREDGSYALSIKGKGGRIREAPIIGPHADAVVERIKNTPADEKVWDRVPSHMDVHSYRSDYATAIYHAYARPIEDIPYDRVNKGTGQRYQSEVYHCRGDRAGESFDKAAMLEASHALGHSRLDVVACHYIR